MRYRFYTADVFTDRIFGGNPLAVFPSAEGLTTDQMQRVARELNLSETVFVLEPEDPENTRRLRIFTPQVELPFAGHPTLGTAHLLAAIGEVPIEEDDLAEVVFEEGIGPVRVTISAQDGQPVFTQLSVVKLPEFAKEIPSLRSIASALSLDISELLLGDDRPTGVSCGVPFLIVPLRSLEALGRARLDRETWEGMLEETWAPHLYPFVYDAETEGATLRARMFAPAMGIEEDPATGAAASALAGYLAALNKSADKTHSWTIEQGFEMGRPSLLEVEADVEGGEVVAIRVGGATVLVSQGEMAIPEPGAAGGLLSQPDAEEESVPALPQAVPNPAAVAKPEAEGEKIIPLRTARREGSASAAVEPKAKARAAQATAGEPGTRPELPEPGQKSIRKPESGKDYEAAIVEAARALEGADVPAAKQSREGALQAGASARSDRAEDTATTEDAAVAADTEGLEDFIDELDADAYDEDQDGDEDEAEGEETHYKLLWSATLRHREQIYACVIIDLSPTSALLQIEDELAYDLTLKFDAPIKIKSDKLGELKGDVVWREKNRLGVDLQDDPKMVARMIKEARK